MTRTLAFALLVAALPALAAGAAAPPAAPSPTPKKGALGSAKEDDFPSPKPAVPAPPPRPGPDVALMRGVMWAFDPTPLEIRSQAIEDLGLLGDARALNVLAQLALDPNQSLARAAVRAVALMQTPRAEEILSNVVRHPTLAEPLKAYAIELLPLQNTTSAFRFLAQVTRTGSLPSSVQMAARRALADIPPNRGGGL